MSNQKAVEKTKKIIVSETTELTDLLMEISNSKSEQIILTFAEQSDLLVSPVNLKVLLDTADESEKVLIAQIIQNTAGIRNAKTASMPTTTSSGKITHEEWEKAEQLMQVRISSKENAFKAVDFDTSAKLSGTKLSHLPSDQNTEINKKQTVDEMVAAAGVIAATKIVTKDKEDFDKLSDQNKEQELTAFQKQVRSTVDKSKHNIDNGLTNKTVNQSGVTVALDHDISKIENASKNEKPVKPASLVGRDFSSGSETKDAKRAHDLAPKKIKLTDRFSTPAIPGVVVKFFGKISAAIKSKNSKKLILLLGIPAIIVLLGIGFFYYRYAPLVKIDMYIESKPVVSEEIYTGNPSVTEFNPDTNQVPVKIETVDNSISDSANATGVATRGTKAGGIVTIRCFIPDPAITQITVGAGTVITDDAGHTFTTLADTPVGCPGTNDTTVQATDFGSEYNVSSGTNFSVGSYGFSEVNAVNLTSFNGGDSSEYKVVSQSDYDNLVGTLQETAHSEAESELKKRSTDGWVIIESTITHTLDGEPETDAGVGTEVDVFNVSIKTKSTAVYYKESDLLAISEEVLLQAAEDQNLFDSESNIELKLDDEIITTITVESFDTGTNTVTLKMNVTGSVKPTVDKDQVIDDLAGQSWEDGLSYLESLEYVSQPTEVKFTPESFPERLRHFPSRQGRIIVVVNEIETVPAE